MRDGHRWRETFARYGTAKDFASPQTADWSGYAARKNPVTRSRHRGLFGTKNRSIFRRRPVCFAMRLDVSPQRRRAWGVNVLLRRNAIIGSIMDWDALQEAIGYRFKNLKLLKEALTHPSLAHENDRSEEPHNQRLEFLGDAVLQLVLTDRLFRLHPDWPEGQLTQTRAHLANRHTLYRRAQAIQLGQYLRLGKGEERNGGRTRLSNLADAYEALLGAVYLDGGWRAARALIHRQFAQEWRQTKTASPRINPKGRLQEIVQAQGVSSPTYRVVQESGPDHEKQFEVVVEWQGREWGRGVGSSKKLAEAAAAAAALEQLGITD